MENWFEITSCVLYSLSFISLILLFGYYLTRYLTNARGGVYSGFTTASLVIVSVGLSVHCASIIIGIILKLTLNHEEDLRRAALCSFIVQYYFYLLSMCILSIVCFKNAKRRLLLIPAKTNRRPQDYGFNNSIFRRWLITATCFSGFICSIGVAIYIQRNKTIENDDFNTTFFIPLLFFNIVTGCLATFNVICIIIIAWILEKSHRSVRRFPPRSTWNSLARGIKETTKSCLIIFMMWSIQITDFCIDNFAGDTNPVIQRFSIILKFVYSMQGFVLFIANFFYRSTRDPNPVLLELKNLKFKMAKCPNKDIEINVI